MSGNPRATRRPRSRVLAALTSAALMISGVVFGAAPASAETTPAISVAVTSVTPTDVSIDVQGSGFDGVGGVYGAVIEAGTEGSVGQDGGFLTVGAWNAGTHIVDGAFHETLVVDATALTRGTDYEVIVWLHRSNPDASTIFDRGAVVLSEDDWNTIDPLPVAVETTTTLSVSPSGQSAPSEEITLTATVSPADAAGEVRFTALAAEGAGEIAAPVAVADGTATAVVTAVPEDLTGFAAEFAPVDAAAFTASVSPTVAHAIVSDEEPEPQPEPEFVPEIGVFLADGTTPYDGTAVHTGDQIVVKGSGFDPEANVGGRGVPIPNTLPQGTYVVFGSFLDQWQPSTGAPSSARSVADQGWVLPAAVVDQVDPRYQGAIRAQWVELAADGTFTATLTAKDFEDAAIDGGSWGVYTYGAGGIVNEAQELSVAVDYVGDAVVPEPEPQPEDGPALAVTPSNDLDPSVENVLTVTGTGFVGTGAANGVYVLFGEQSIWQGDGPLPMAGWLSQAWLTPGQIVDGAFTTTVTVPAGSLDADVEYHVATSAAHALALTDRSMDAFAAVTVGEDSGAVPPAPGDDDEQPVTPAPAADPEPVEVCVANAVNGASFSWGVKSSFVGYINGPIAKGSVSGGWSSGSGAFSPQTGNGTVHFGGSMHFTGHGGALDLTLSNPTVRVSGGSATLYVDVQSKGYNGNPSVNASGVAFATLSSAGGISGGELGANGVGATLTSAGAAAFAGFYAAGDALDPVSFSFPLGAEVPCDESTGGLAVTGGEPAAGAAALGLGLLVMGLVLVATRRRQRAEV